MLIGDWADEKNLESTKYHILINRHKVDVKQLNKHVLECILPKFDQIYQDEQLNIILLNNSCNDSYSSENFDFNPNTLVYIYENNILYCQPLLFQIKFTSK
jgi:hypothetical protein